MRLFYIFFSSRCLSSCVNVVVIWSNEQKKLKSTQIFFKLVSHLSSTPFFLTTDAYRRVALYYIVTLPLHRMYAYYYFYYMNLLTDKHYILFYVQVAPKCNNFPPKISSMLKCILLPILIYFYLVT